MPYERQQKAPIKSGLFVGFISELPVRVYILHDTVAPPDAFNVLAWPLHADVAWLLVCPLIGYETTGGVPDTDPTSVQLHVQSFLQDELPSNTKTEATNKNFFIINWFRCEIKKRKELIRYSPAVIKYLPGFWFIK